MQVYTLLLLLKSFKPSTCGAVVLVRFSLVGSLYTYVYVEILYCMIFARRLYAMLFASSLD